MQSWPVMESQYLTTSQDFFIMLIHTHNKLADTWGCRAAVCLHIHVAAHACTQNVVGRWIIMGGAHIGWTSFGRGGRPPPCPTSSYTPALDIASQLIVGKLICFPHFLNHVLSGSF